MSIHTDKWNNNNSSLFLRLIQRLQLGVARVTPETEVLVTVGLDFMWLGTVSNIQELTSKDAIVNLFMMNYYYRCPFFYTYLFFDYVLICFRAPCVILQDNLYT